MVNCPDGIPDNARRKLKNVFSRQLPRYGRLVGGECQSYRNVADSWRPLDRFECDDSRRWRTIEELIANNDGVSEETRQTNFQLKIIPAIVSNFMADAGFYGITWVGCVLNKNLDQVINDIKTNFRGLCEEVSELAGEILVFRNIGDPGGVAVRFDRDLPVGQVTKGYYLDIHSGVERDAYYVNFSAEHLGGGVANSNYMEKDALGWAMEETIAFQSNQLPLLYETKTLRDGSKYSNLILGLDKCPVILRVKQLFILKEPFGCQRGGKRRMILQYINEGFEGMQLENTHIYWICMAAQNLRGISDRSIIEGKLRQMFWTAVQAFEQCVYRWKAQKLHRRRYCDASDKLKINTGAWGVGVFSVHLEVSMSLQYIAALHVREKNKFWPIVLDFHLSPNSSRGCSAFKRGQWLLEDLKKLRYSLESFERNMLPVLTDVQTMKKTSFRVNADGEMVKVQRLI